MANRTDFRGGHQRASKGTDPQYLIEKIVREKIIESPYYKEHCFGLTAELLVDKAIELQYFGGTYGGNRRPAQFLCLILKMLQLQPEKEIIIEFILNDDYKYVRLLGAFYLRLMGKPIEIYKYLEPLLRDFRKVRFKEPSGKCVITHVDEVIDALLTKDYYLDIVLPRLPKRQMLEESVKLEPRETGLKDLEQAEREQKLLTDASMEVNEDAESDSDQDKESKTKVQTLIENTLKAQQELKQSGEMLPVDEEPRKRETQGRYVPRGRMREQHRAERDSKRSKSRSRSRSGDRKNKDKDSSSSSTSMDTSKDRRRSRSRSNSRSRRKHSRSRSRSRSRKRSRSRARDRDRDRNHRRRSRSRDHDRSRGRSKSKSKDRRRSTSRGRGKKRPRSNSRE